MVEPTPPTLNFLSPIANPVQLPPDQTIQKAKVDHLLSLAKNSANKAMVTGLGWILLGLVFTAISYALPFGGFYLIMTGAILSGFYQFFKGFYFRLFPKQLLKKALAQTQIN